MPVIQPGLFKLMRRFPAEKDTLHRLYLSNHTFQNICIDYQECIRAHEYWSHTGDNLAPERCCEYKELQENLEQEIKDYLGSEQRAEKYSQKRHE